MSKKHKANCFLKTFLVWYSIVVFNVPLDTL